MGRYQFGSMPAGLPSRKRASTKGVSEPLAVILLLALNHLPLSGRPSHSTSPCQPSSVISSSTGAKTVSDGPFSNDNSDYSLDLLTQPSIEPRPSRPVGLKRQPKFQEIPVASALLRWRKCHEGLKPFLVRGVARAYLIEAGIMIGGTKLVFVCQFALVAKSRQSQRVHSVTWWKMESKQPSDSHVYGTLHCIHSVLKFRWAMEADERPWSS